MVFFCIDRKLDFLLEKRTQSIKITEENTFTVFIIVFLILKFSPSVSVCGALRCAVTLRGQTPSGCASPLDGEPPCSVLALALLSWHGLRDLRLFAKIKHDVKTLKE